MTGFKMTNNRLPVWVCFFILAVLAIIIGVAARLKTHADEDSPVKEENTERIQVYTEDLGVLYCNANSLIENKEKEIVFVLDSRLQVEDVNLFVNGKQIAKMSEGDVDGFEKQGITTYTTTISYAGEKDGYKYTFYAASGSNKSTKVELYAFDEVTKEDEDAANAYIDYLIEKISDYSDEEGFVLPDKKEIAVQTIIDELEIAVQKNEIVQYINNENGISFQMSSGLWVSYAPITKDEYEEYISLYSENTNISGNNKEEK